MYPFVKLAIVLFKARSRSRLKLLDKSVLHCRVGLTDADLFMELNNARYLSYMELGRWDYSQRVGFVAMMKENNWGIAVGGASVRYRRRIPLFKKFTLTTQLICHDGRWIYFLQEAHSKNKQGVEKICASALMKVCVTSKDGLVPAPEVLLALGETISDDVPDWVAAMIAAEGQRPWPKS